MKKIILIVTTMFAGISGYAQDFVDNALLFSRLRPAGSARIQSLGGAQVSLGGDYSSAMSNPAGLGMFNRSEFTLSAGMTFVNSDSEYLGSASTDSKSAFNIPGLSIVLHKSSERESGFMGGSFAITLNRINDFNKDFQYSGTNDQNSLIDYFLNYAQGADPNSFLLDQHDEPGSEYYSITGLAYRNFLIEDFFDSQNNEYYYTSELTPLPADPDNPAEIRTLDQSETSESKGAQYQWAISYGANFSDKWFVGASLGIVSLKYKIHQTFHESNFRYSEDPDYQPIDYFRVREDFDIRGSGVNFTIGGIVRPVDFLQIGASLVTPTFYSITDVYDAGINSVWKMYNVSDPSFPSQPNVEASFDQPLVSDYKLKTPMRLTTGATLIAKYGFISADVEFINYTRSKYKSDYGSYEPENTDIKAEYQSAVNYRVGAEYRYEKFRLRGGYNFLADPFESSETNRSQSAVTAGAGFRSKHFYIDAAAIFSSSRATRVPYSVDGPDPVAKQKYNTSVFLMTFGFPF